jgi:hypothetical protein
MKTLESCVERLRKVSWTGHVGSGHLPIWAVVSSWKDYKRLVSKTAWRNFKADLITDSFSAHIRSSPLAFEDYSAFVKKWDVQMKMISCMIEPYLSEIFRSCFFPNTGVAPAVELEFNFDITHIIKEWLLFDGAPMTPFVDYLWPVYECGHLPCGAVKINSSVKLSVF